MAAIELFSGPNCVHCQEVKMMLDERGLEYEEYNISDKGHLEDYMRRLPRSRSVPQIFVHGEHIGNEQDFRIIANDGRLQTMLDS